MLPFESRISQVMVKKEAKTSPKFGYDPENRPVNELIEFGVVNIDKPSGPSSHQVSAYVKQILGIKKAGHSGTLDPAVTGVLPVGLGRATRIVHALLKAGKEYICLMHLHKPVPEPEIKAVMDEFTGEIDQLPPVRSAVKRRHRTRTIYYIEILDIQDQDVLFKVGCEAGTYIRKLCHDIGTRLNVGAHMTQLRRSKAGPFNELKITTLQDLKDAFYLFKEENNDKLLKEIIFPIEQGVSHLNKIWVLDTTVNNLCHGASLKFPGISKLNSGIKHNELVAVLTLKNELVMTGLSNASSKEIMKKNKGIAVKPVQVFMNPDIYPKIEK